MSLPLEIRLLLFICLFLFFQIEPQPIVNVILRGGFGRHAWAFQLRQLPRHRYYYFQALPRFFSRAEVAGS